MGENSGKLVELSPDRSLLNPNFDGYKLSLSEISAVSHNFENPVYRLVPSENYYSLPHAKLFMLQNHLYGEIQGGESVYFVDNSWEIQKYTLDSLTNRFEVETLWQIPQRHKKEENSYNVSVHLTSEALAVVSDGMGLLYLVDRGSTGDSDPWKVVFTGEVLPSPNNQFVITDSVYTNSEKPEIDLLLTSIVKTDEKFATALHWITLRKDEHSWNQVALRELRVNSHVQFASLERNSSCSQAVYVVSDSSCKFILDSENEIISLNNSGNNEEINFETNYTWTQTNTEIAIKFRLDFDEENAGDSYSSSINVTIQPESVSIKCKEENLLSCLLYQRVDPALSCWKLTSCRSFLEITLAKREGGLIWPQLGKLEASCESCEVVGTVFNSQQVEECDFECEKVSVFERLQRDSHETTHRVNLGSHRVLLTVALDRGRCRAVGVRSDVDACIWQPRFDDNDEGFSVKHSGTLLSLAYIQASKQQMKFFEASPDLSTSVICDNRHVFIYSQNKAIGGGNELRNRASGRRFTNLAQQQVFSLPNSSSSGSSSDEVLGVFVSNNYIYILGQLFITALKL